MKVNKIIIGFMLMLVSAQITSAQDHDLKHPVGYLNALGQEYREIAKAQLDYTRAVGHGKREKKVNKRRAELLTEIAEARRNVRRMPAFNGSTQLRDSVVSYLNVNYHVTNDDYEKIINLEEVAERSYDDMEALLLAQELISEKMANAADNLDAQQDLFAVENNIDLVENETKLGRKMKQANRTIGYSNDLYLIFFKSYKQESYMLDAMRAADLNAMEQNKNALMQYSQEGLKKLKSVKSFDGDQSLIKACTEILTFYADEAENKFPAMMEYYLEAEKFEKVKTAFEKIKQSKRTQANIDQYNEGIRALNAASEKYNNISTALNKQRSKFLNNWNKRKASFMNKHTP